MDINCIVALQIPSTSFKPQHCFIREICGWRNSACSNYSDLIRIREVTWMKLRGTCTKGNALVCGPAGRGRTESTFMAAAAVTPAPKPWLSLLFAQVHTGLLFCLFCPCQNPPSPAQSSCLLQRQAERIHFNLINNLVDRITQFPSSASFVWSATTRLTFGVASPTTKHNKHSFAVKFNTFMK